ncbi:MAG: prolipoprotein diacylglyceryl transferase [Alphaproteobacteria bacterium]|nr:prolipoprotein diacylglyceryl transferase [Rickettsiales bacterium]
MQFPEIDPFIIRFSETIGIRWYSLPYIFGFFMSKFNLKKVNKYKKFATKEQLDNVAMVSLISIIFGARIGYILVYDLSYFINSPLEIFSIWNGGLSFYGGLIGFAIGACLYSKNANIGINYIFDSTAFAVPISIFFGRIANFINAELYGRPTNSAIGVIFPTDPLGLPRHPSQLYESAIEGILLFLVIFLLSRNKRIASIPYSLSLSFAILYPFFRFFLEFFREPDQQIGFLFNYITMGQILCVVFFIAALLSAVYYYKQRVKGKG